MQNNKKKFKKIQLSNGEAFSRMRDTNNYFDAVFEKNFKKFLELLQQKLIRQGNTKYIFP